MGFKDALAKKYSEAYLNKYGDRITQVQGRVLSIKVSTKTVLWIYHKLIVDVLVKPESSKVVMRCQYSKKRWFKKPAFMTLNQGHSVIVQGVKGKKGKEDRDIITIMNIINFTTKQDLVPTGQPQAQNIKRQIVRK
jgi:hypothetical protein